MSVRARRAAALLALIVAAAGSLATNLSYAALEGEWTDRVTVGPGETAVMRRVVITITPEALPETEGLLSGGTYGPITARFPQVDGLQVAILDRTEARPAFQPAAEHVLLDSADCELAAVCRRTVDVVISQPAAATPLDVDWSIDARVYVPGGELPAGAALTVEGLEAAPSTVTVHELTAELDGEAVLQPDRPVDVSLSYTPARGTRARLHGLAVEVTFDGPQPVASGVASTLSVNLSRVGGTDGGEEIVIGPNETATRELQPLSSCLGSCRVTYRLSLVPPGSVGDAPATATWRVSGWLFAMSDPDAAPPTFELTGGQAEPTAGG